MTSLRVAACQFTAGADPAANLAIAVDSVARAAAAGARLAVLPEATMVCFGSDLGAAAQPLDGPFAEGLREIARSAGLTVVAGLFEPSGDGRVYNTLLLTGPSGEATYRKIHLFDALGSRESEFVAPGRDLVTADVEGTRIGLSTCYDVRFGDHFTALGRAGAHLVVLPASWGAGPDKAEQWDVLVRARAMDAQAWLLAAGQAWTTPRDAHPLGIGRSALVDPLGHVHAQLASGPGELVSDIDLDAVTRARASVPIL